MKILKYFLYSQLVFRLDINIFNRYNYLIPKFVYTGPTAPYDTKHHTIGLILPFLQILFDFDCESEKDKIEIFKSQMDDYHNQNSPLGDNIENL